MKSLKKFNHLTFQSVPKVNKTTVGRWVGAMKGMYRGMGNRTIAVMHDNTANYSALGILCEITEPEKWKHREGYLWHDDYLTFPSSGLLQRQGIPVSLAMLVYTLNEDCGKSLGFTANYLDRKYLKRISHSHKARRRGTVIKSVYRRMVVA
ncbi:hypothetical protein GO755_40070 [Spirosoma sp. HMF4905]|uniref:Uncharacterized protein n=1 Tax=Spirosoma arboris TaxID=2682092 RepID=A0A7K1SR37_9BACT|nr:hypothetical protein [Spirosoma arboris]MVM36274.1 hypothetical protein [Spirosoma arboris]